MEREKDNGKKEEEIRVALLVRVQNPKPSIQEKKLLKAVRNSEEEHANTQDSERESFTFEGRVELSLLLSLSFFLLSSEKDDERFTL